MVVVNIQLETTIVTTKFKIEPFYHFKGSAKITFNKKPEST